MPRWLIPENLGMGLNFEEGCSRKEWSPRLLRCYMDRCHPKSFVSLNGADRSLTRLLGSRAVPSTSRTNRGGPGGSGLTMSAMLWSPAWKRRHQPLLSLWMCVSKHHETDPRRNDESINPLMAPHCTYPGFSTLPVFRGWRYDCCPFLKIWPLSTKGPQILAMPGTRPPRA